MLRIIQCSNALPFQFPVDPSSEFQPGQLGQLYGYNNQIVCGVSNGTIPLGVIDDIKTKAFTHNAIDEVIITPAIGELGPNNTLVTPIDIKAELENPHIIPSSFRSSSVDVELNPRNGIITFLAGTQLNYSMTGTGNLDAIRTVVNYTFQIPNIPGDDSTLGSGKVTVWFNRMIFQTDQYDTSAVYILNAPLFCNDAGLWTTKRLSQDYPAIGIVTAPPNPVFPFLEVLFL